MGSTVGISACVVDLLELAVGLVVLGDWCDWCSFCLFGRADIVDI